MSIILSRFLPVRRSLLEGPTAAVLLLISALSVGSLSLAGCGLGNTAQIQSASTLSSPAFEGRAFGGPNPIIGATVKVYTTGNPDGSNGGYGVATFRQEANAVTNPSGYPSGDTDTGGSFRFAGGYACPSGQYLYLVSSGGNTGASPSASGAAATATETGGAVTSITVTNGGSGYLSATVAITSADGLGSGATATAEVTGGVVTKITITAAGSGYDKAPNVTVSAPTTTNSANNNAVLVAALGSCDSIYSGGKYLGGPIFVNELTTISAAYALGHFSSESGSGASTVVSIGAPATNNASEVSGVSTGCVLGDGVEGDSSQTCAATASAGLAHAFLNAANLVNISPTNGATAGANLALPGNSSAVAPQALVNSLGNVLVACVNSAGGVSNDGSACGSVFKATTIGSSVPVDTFGAMVNLAANPTLGGSATGAKNFLALANGFTSVYSPSLSTTTGVNDLSLAINYPSGTGAVTGAQGITYPSTAALDMNDVYYIGNQSSSSGGVGENIVALSSNGSVLGASPNGSTLTHEYGLSVDALGNGYFGNSSNSIGYFKVLGGVPAQYSIVAAGNDNIYATAVDRKNNVWALGSGSSTSGTIIESAAGGGSFTAIASPTVTLNGNYVDIAIDPDQNVWTVAGTGYSVVQNTGTASAPTYASASLLTGTTSGSPAVGITFAGTSPFSSANPYSVYVSSYSTAPGLQVFTPALSTNGEVTSVSSGSLQTGGGKISGSFYDQADGDGTIWTADTSGHSIDYFPPSTSIAYRYEPCLITSGACASIFTTGKPFNLSIDSTGSIWTTVPATGNVVQIIGAAAPTVPLLSLGLTGRP
jgi:hypothetical protein